MFARRALGTARSLYDVFSTNSSGEYGRKLQPCRPVGTVVRDHRTVTASLPHGVSALVDPADEPYLRLLELCARTRRRLGLPAHGAAELAALLERRVAAAGPSPLPPNVILFRRPRRRRR